MCFQLRNFWRRKRKQHTLQRTHRNINHLFVFDFDHTMIEENSDIAVTKLLNEPIPDEIQNFYDGQNWIEYMDKVMKHIGSSGFDINSITAHIKNLQLTPGIEHLLQRIRKIRDKDPSNHFIVISDSNDYFISTVLSKVLPSVEPNKIFSNRAMLPIHLQGSSSLITHNYMKIRPFEDQTDCQICPRNLCKGKALTKYMMTQGPFSHTYYIGDGINDLCPSLYLGESDTLFVRRGFGLEKVIREKRIGEYPVILNCNIVYWTSGEEIEKHIQFDRTSEEWLKSLKKKSSVQYHD